MAGLLSGRMDARVLQVPDWVSCWSGLQDGTRRGQTLGGVSRTHCETEFRHPRCIHQCGVEAPVLWGRIAKYVLWKVEERWKIKGCCAMFGGEGDDEYLFIGLMWADHCWLFSEDTEKLMWMVTDIIEELLDLDMEPKLEYEHTERLR